MRSPSGDEEGFALPQAIWAVGALSLLAIMLVRETASRSSDVSLLAARMESEAAIEGAVRIGAAYFDRTTGDARFGRIACTLDRQKLLITLRPETARVDINASSSIFLGMLMEAVGLDSAKAETIAARIVDYRDADDTPEDEGAERPDYLRKFDLDYGPRNGPYETVDELAYVPGVDSDIMNRLLPHITVHARTSRIDREYADAVVLTALDRFDSSGAGNAIRTPVVRQPSVPSQQFRSAGGATRTALNLRIVARGAGGYTAARQIVLSERFRRFEPVRALEWRMVTVSEEEAAALNEPFGDCLGIG